MTRFLTKWCICLAIVIGVNTSGFGQETDRSPFALEFPELNTGRLTQPKNYVMRTDINIVRFWTMNPAAETIEWGKIKIRINRQSANRICANFAAMDGKIVRCDLNRFAGFRLNPKENFFEIEAEGKDGKRYNAQFIVVTDAAAASRDLARSEPGTPKKPSTGLAFSGRRFAVVMGVSKYRYNDIGLGNLNYADADATALNDWLTEKGGFSPQDILYLTNEKATLTTVRDSLIRFLTKATETDLVLFFFAGHGTPDPQNPSELYYLVHDSKVGDLRHTAFPMTELKRIIDSKMRSKRAIFLLDTCHSAGLSGNKVVGLDRRKPGERDLGETGFDERQLERVQIKNDVSQAATRLFGSPGRAVLTSSDTGEASREGPRWGGGHGVFTWMLLEGLNGQADANGNRVITAEELFNFVREQVRTETGSKQNPRLFSNLASGLEIAVLK